MRRHVLYSCLLMLVLTALSTSQGVIHSESVLLKVEKYDCNYWSVSRSMCEANAFRINETAKFCIAEIMKRDFSVTVDAYMRHIYVHYDRNCSSDARKVQPFVEGSLVQIDDNPVKEEVLCFFAVPESQCCEVDGSCTAPSDRSVRHALGRLFLISLVLTWATILIEGIVVVIICWISPAFLTMLSGGEMRWLANRMLYLQSVVRSVVEDVIASPARTPIYVAQTILSMCLSVFFLLLQILLYGFVGPWQLGEHEKFTCWVLLGFPVFIACIFAYFHMIYLGSRLSISKFRLYSLGIHQASRGLTFVSHAVTLLAVVLLTQSPLLVVCQAVLLILASLKDIKVALDFIMKGGDSGLAVGKLPQRQAQVQLTKHVMMMLMLVLHAVMWILCVVAVAFGVLTLAQGAGLVFSAFYVREYLLPLPSFEAPFLLYFVGAAMVGCVINAVVIFKNARNLALRINLLLSGPGNSLTPLVLGFTAAKEVAKLTISHAVTLLHAIGALVSWPLITPSLCVFLASGCLVLLLGLDWIDLNRLGLHIEFTLASPQALVISWASLACVVSGPAALLFMVIWRSFSRRVSRNYYTLLLTLARNQTRQRSRANTVTHTPHRLESGSQGSISTEQAVMDGVESLPLMSKPTDVQMATSLGSHMTVSSGSEEEHPAYGSYTISSMGSLNTPGDKAARLTLKDYFSREAD